MYQKFLLLLAALGLNAYTVHEPTTSTISLPICHTTVNDMASMAADPNFQMLHELPAPFRYQGQGETVTFKTPDGKMGSGFLIKSAKKSNKWLFVYQEWWGLNDHIKQESLKLYQDLEGVNVLALDMYDGQIGTTREEAGKLMQAASKERLEAITEGAFAYVGPKAKVASIGWCFGGMLSLQNAIIGADQVVGCVMYYGRPEQDISRLKKLPVDVLGIFGSQDQGISPEVVAKFEQDMKTANKKLTVKMYDAVHGFANPSNPKHDAAATADAYKLSLAYLKSKF
ncbi:carboxymethylenebutenolidase [Dyadobacter jejuensis]|uniref:Carboxymethylenebutenolidase n=1 Tax=Dyadobacter jejuensis TaxID=1082580 RepID=A0A316AHU4_9BACT|nr:dienelactone hydrolase family protein [Dyadobacter jejuensis]PWJ57211.1 carboxymethylenebutenolidase [Dyadobacter jejuensis]